MTKGREQWQAEALLLAQGETVEQALRYLAGQYERLTQAQSLTIASLEGLVNDLKAENLELVDHLKLQAAQWSGTVARQRLTIQEQGQKVVELRDQVAGLQEHIKHLNSSPASSPASPKDLEKMRALLEGREDDASSGNR